jgi:hypothetical protein
VRKEEVDPMERVYKEKFDTHLQEPVIFTLKIDFLWVPAMLDPMVYHSFWVSPQVTPN